MESLPIVLARTIPRLALFCGDSPENADSKSSPHCAASTAPQDKLVNPEGAILLSVTMVLVFGASSSEPRVGRGYSYRRVPLTLPGASRLPRRGDHSPGRLPALRALRVLRLPPPGTPNRLACRRPASSVGAPPPQPTTAPPGATRAPQVYGLMILLSPIGWPLSKMLDWVLGTAHVRRRPPRPAPCCRLRRSDAGALI